jgi:hypothetical protein
MSNYALSWRRTSLIFTAISIVILIPHQLNAKGFEPPAWEREQLLLMLGQIWGAVLGFSWYVLKLVQSNLTARNTGIALGAGLAVFGAGMEAVGYVMRPGPHNETGNANLKILGTNLSFRGTAPFAVIFAGIITIVLSFKAVS